MQLWRGLMAASVLLPHLPMSHSESDRLDDCLPANLRGTATTITRIAGGLSGAGVHRVDTDGRAFLLKISRSDESIDTWRAPRRQRR